MIWHTILNIPKKLEAILFIGIVYLGALECHQEVRISMENQPYNGFEYALPIVPGVYEVIMELGGPKPSNTTIYTESRRLLLREFALPANEYAELSFLVDVRRPLLRSGDSIAVKERDRHLLNWDEYLNMEFVGSPQVKSMSIKEAKEVRTLYLAGNSTVADQDTEPWASWGQMLPYFFGQDIVVANYAESGSSLHDFKQSNRLDAILERIQAEDILLIEFGHNDQKRKGKGIGPWASYTDYLIEYVEKARAKGAIPVVISPIQRRFFNGDGTVKNTHGDYPAAVRKVAADLDIPLIDLTELTRQMYEAWGVEGSKRAFMHYPEGFYPGQATALTDNTHHNSFGAFEIAHCVVEELLNWDLGLEDKLNDGYRPYQASAPSSFEQWTLPPSQRYKSIQVVVN